jgi:hypothetical protein
MFGGYHKENETFKDYCKNKKGNKILNTKFIYDNFVSYLERQIGELNESLKVNSTDYITKSKKHHFDINDRIKLELFDKAFTRRDKSQKTKLEQTIKSKQSLDLYNWYYKLDNKEKLNQCIQIFDTLEKYKSSLEKLKINNVVDPLDIDKTQKCFVFDGLNKDINEQKLTVEQQETTRKNYEFMEKIP